QSGRRLRRNSPSFTFFTEMHCISAFPADDWKTFTCALARSNRQSTATLLKKVLLNLPCTLNSDGNSIWRFSTLKWPVRRPASEAPTRRPACTLTERSLCSVTCPMVPRRESERRYCTRVLGEAGWQLTGLERR